ncbi:hypothetical protein C7999DRAFT_44980 [Corynascus novoguineensis]|uniref:Uncharacterized protein n=1 Tax=Corynascus novoguineensis TaxID=1126955 RepID=A0AAN7CJA5_9PEZI|nr:hypothetical protein C7999DRAFT_44980 [Corynascus novoguineensis]
MTSNTDVYYRVYINAYVGSPRDHHGIFVELEEDGSGYLYHVEGSVQTGMTYVYKPAKNPLFSVAFTAQKTIGYVRESNYGYIHDICSSIPPPAKQYDGPKRLIPKDQKLRRCQEWTQEVISALRARGVLEGAHSTSKSSTSSTSEPADGAVSPDGFWRYSRYAKDWYRIDEHGQTI